ERIWSGSTVASCAWAGSARASAATAASRFIIERFSLPSIVDASGLRLLGVTQKTPVRQTPVNPISGPKALNPKRCRTRGAGNLFRPRVSLQGPFVPDLTQYLPILIFLAIALGLSTAFVFLPMGVARLTGAHNPNAEKLSEYECGFPAFEDSRSQFDVRFYLIAILFIVFDLEAAFLFPWAVSLDLTGWPGWITMMVFLFELAVGLAYAWKKGALDWE